jgi:hypothetical protein
MEGNGIISHCDYVFSVKVIAPNLSKGEPADLISPYPVFAWTRNEPFSWFAVDFGEERRIQPTHYSLRYGSSGDYCCPRNWLLQATNQVEAITV